MRAAGQDQWWRQTSRLAGGTLAVVAVLAIVPILLSRSGSEMLILGLPAMLFVLAILMPLAALGAIFWFAGRQVALDHHYDVTGD